jgi:hypothetical protein
MTFKTLNIIPTRYSRVVLTSYHVLHFHVPRDEHGYHLCDHERVVDAVLHPRRALLYVEDVEHKDPTDDNVVDDLGQGATLVVYAAAKVCTLKEKQELNSSETSCDN